MAYPKNSNQSDRIRLMFERERELKQKILNTNYKKNDEFDGYDYKDRNDNFNSCYNGDHNHYIPQSPSSRENEYHIKLNVLTDENKKLREKYADLLQKTNKLIDAYRKIDGENKELRLKVIKDNVKQKRKEHIYSILSGLWNSINSISKKIIVWFNS